ncbi:hypothetical protein BDW68DRAFT_116883 [Aspergillus falconensis]
MLCSNTTKHPRECKLALETTMPHLKSLIRAIELEKQIRRDMRKQQTWLQMPSEVVPIRKRRVGKGSFSRRTLRR